MKTEVELMANGLRIHLHYFDINVFEMSALNCASLTAVLDQVAIGVSRRGSSVC